MTVKEQAIKLIRRLPDESTFEDIQYHLYVREKVNRGIDAVDQGLVVPQVEAEKRVRQWLKSSGRSRR